LHLRSTWKKAVKSDREGKGHVIATVIAAAAVHSFCCWLLADKTAARRKPVDSQRKIAHVRSLLYPSGLGACPQVDEMIPQVGKSQLHDVVAPDFIRRLNTERSAEINN